MPRLERFFLQTIILAKEELRDLLFRRRAMLSLLLYIGVIVVVVISLALIENRLMPTMAVFRQDSPERQALLEQVARYGWRSEFELVLKIGALPGPVVIMQLFSLLWFPTLVALVSCDMLAIDIYRGTLRFLLGRTGRSTYFFGKFAAHYLLYFLLQLFTLAALFAACLSSVANFNAAEYLSALLSYFGVFLVFLWFVVATTQFISCWSSRPMNAVIRLHLLWVVFVAAVFIYPKASPLNGEIVLGLVAAPFQGAGLKSAAHLSLWALGFTLAGLLLFRRRAL